MGLVKIIIIILVILGGLLMFTDPFFLKDPCDDERIQKEISVMYEKLTTFPEGQNALEQVERKIQEGVLPESEKENVLRANIEMGIRTQRECAVPAELKQRLTQAYVNSAPGTKICPDGQFATEAGQSFQQLRQSPAYPQYEQKARTEIINQIPNEEGKTLFDRKWQDASFRERVMTAMFAMVLREQNQCRNPALPMAGIVQEIIR